MSEIQKQGVKANFAASLARSEAPMCALTFCGKETLQHEDRRSDQEEGAKGEEDDAEHAGPLGVARSADFLDTCQAGPPRGALASACDDAHRLGAGMQPSSPDSRRKLAAPNSALSILL